MMLRMRDLQVIVLEESSWSALETALQTFFASAGERKMVFIEFSREHAYPRVQVIYTE